MPDEITFNLDANVPFIDFALGIQLHLQWNEFNEMLSNKKSERTNEVKLLAKL